MLNLDQAFSSKEIKQLEDLILDLNKNGIYDPRFLSNAKKFLTSIESIENIVEMEENKTKTGRFI